MQNEEAARGTIRADQSAKPQGSNRSHRQVNNPKAEPKAGWHPAELLRKKMKGTGKARDVDVRNANEMRTVEEAKRRLINQ